MSNPPLIGIMGFAGAGKDESADYLLQALPVPGYKRAVAKPLYDMINALLNDMGIERRWSDRQWKEAPLQGLGVSPRHLLQTLGTEWGRGLNPSFWLKPLDAALIRINKKWGRALVVPDIRFHNEADWILENGGQLLLIDRPAVSPVREHVSETLMPWVGRPHSVVDNSSDFPHLHNQLERLAEKIFEGLYG